MLPSWLPSRVLGPVGGWFLMGSLSEVGSGSGKLAGFMAKFRDSCQLAPFVCSWSEVAPFKTPLIFLHGSWVPGRMGGRCGPRNRSCFSSYACLACSGMPSCHARYCSLSASIWECVNLNLILLLLLLLELVLVQLLHVLFHFLLFFYLLVRIFQQPAGSGADTFLDTLLLMP